VCWHQSAEGGRLGFDLSESGHGRLQCPEREPGPVEEGRQPGLGLVIHVFLTPLLPSSTLQVSSQPEVLSHCLPFLVTTLSPGRHHRPIAL
jgi:hypothetical protein